KEQRAAAVADVATMGVVSAAKKHGAPQGCVSRWAKDAGVKREEVPAPRSARKPRATARGPSADERPEPERQEQPAEEPKREVPAATAANAPAPSEPSRRTLKSRVAKLYTPSQKAVILEDAKKDGITAASKKHGVSRFAIYAWDRKVAKAATGDGPSPTTGPSPKEIEAQRDQEILGEWHRHPGLGPSQIRNQLRRKSIKVSVNTVRRVMEDA